MQVTTTSGVWTFNGAFWLDSQVCFRTVWMRTVVQTKYVGLGPSGINAVSGQQCSSMFCFHLAEMNVLLDWPINEQGFLFGVCLLLQCFVMQRHHRWGGEFIDAMWHHRAVPPPPLGLPRDRTLTYATCLLSAVLGCSNSKSKKIGHKCYNIPKNPVRREKWLEAIRREHWTPTEHSRLYNEHKLTPELTLALVTLHVRRHQSVISSPTP